MKTLYRSKKNKILAGIIGGLGEYFEIDPSLFRLVWLLIVVFTGFFPGLVVYIFATFVIPKEP
jgi:phage shock protein C